MEHLIGAVTCMIAVTTLAGVVSAQGVVLVKPNVPPPSPVVEPEHCFRVPANPNVIFQNLTSESSVNRRLGLSQLGWNDAAKHGGDSGFIGNARFYRVTLDDDAEMEAILMLDLGFTRGIRALIFKNTGGAWWCIGQFSLSSHWRRNDAERMIELRSIVDPDHLEILVRVTGGGTDIEKGIELSIYRVFAGRLYRTFQTSEESAVRRVLAPDKAVVDEERCELFYPDTTRGEQPYIVLHHIRRTVPDQEWGRIGSTQARSNCSPYRWDPVKYQFIADRSAVRKYCPASK